MKNLDFCLFDLGFGIFGNDDNDAIEFSLLSYSKFLTPCIA